MSLCIFCGNSANSKEDLFPRWIHQRVKTREPLSRRIGDAKPTITEDQEVRIPCVCSTCNNGWMSRLEIKCKPLIGSLIEGLCINLDAEHRKFLSEWALKAALVNDACREGHRFFTDTECYAFKSNHRQIPDGTGIWAGFFTGRTLSAVGSEFHLDSPTTKKIATGHVFTICVGHLILQTLSLHKQSNIRTLKVAVDPSIRWDDMLVPLWPPLKPKNQKVTWPPKLSFALEENPHFGNLHYARLLFRWNVRDGHTLTY